MLRDAVFALDTGEIAVLFIVLVVFALWAAWRAYKNISHARTIEDHPTSRARSAHQGYVELQGIGKWIDDEPVVAPYSGAHCLWYRFKVEEAVHTRHGRHWRTVKKGASTDTFLLEDETGEAVIDPEGAEVAPVKSRTWYDTRADMVYGSAESQRFAQKLGVLNQIGSRYRYTEEYLFPQRTIYAIGRLRNLQSHVAGPSLRERTGAILREWKSDSTELHSRFDLDGDGKIDEQEWMLARRQAQREAEKEKREEMKKYNDGINIMIKPSDSRRPYIISGVSPEKLTRRYRIYAMLLVLGFFISGSLALYIFNIRLLAMLSGQGEI